VLRRSLCSVALVVSMATACAPAPSADPVHGRPGVTVAATAHDDTSTPFNLVSLPSLIHHDYDGRDLVLGAVVGEDLASTSHAVTYRSGDLVVSGRLTVPRREGRFPLLVLAHGYEDPATYRSGAALSREVAYFSARGYVVMAPDYRDYGTSEHVSDRPETHPLGYPEDLINGVLALRRAHLPYVDGSRVAVLGRSMGGGVALAAVEARPRLFDALVLYSSVSSSAADNYARWVAGTGDLDERVVAAYGTPEDNPRFWHEASARNYLERVDVPVQVHHGTADTTCPVWWSRTTVAYLRRAGQTVEYYEYPGEPHRFGAAWPVMAARVAKFLEANI
jgi:dipeptidyl aminopeptidase/acylaminoacyl peptidase